MIMKDLLIGELSDPLDAALHCGYYHYEHGSKPLQRVSVGDT